MGAELRRNHWLYCDFGSYQFYSTLSFKGTVYNFKDLFVLCCVQDNHFRIHLAHALDGQFVSSMDAIYESTIAFA